MKFMYANVELNVPHHLNYVTALPCKCTQRIAHVKPLSICAKKHQTLFRRTSGDVANLIPPLCTETS